MPPINVLLAARELASVDKKIVPQSPDPTCYDSSEGRCIMTAFRQFCVDKPFLQVRVVPVPLVTPSTYSYVLTDIEPLWVADYFKIRRIQYPLDVINSGQLSGVDLDEQSNSINRDHYSLTQDPATSNWILRFSDGYQPYQNFGFWYTSPHLWDPIANTSSLNPMDEDMLVQLAAVKILQKALIKTAGWSVNSDVGINVADLRQGYKEVRDECQLEYDRLIKSVPKVVGPVFSAMETRDRWGGRLWHGRRSGWVG